MVSLLRCSAAVFLLGAATCLSLHGVGELRLDTVAEGLEFPVWAGQAPGQPDRLYVAEQASGRIQVVDLATGELAPAPFLALEDHSTGGEYGLLGVAFAPDYEASGAVFVNFTNTDGNTVIRRYHTTADNPMVLDPAMAVDLLVVDQIYQNHNGGWIAFGPDGYLYIAMGDGGGSFDPGDEGQDTTSLLGAMLRIDVPTARGTDGYAIPEANPFADGVDGAPEILHYGLRNPWRNSFDRATGELWIADVGQHQFEEIHVAAPDAAGLNFGWVVKEGFAATGEETMGPPPDDPSLVDPFHVYPHDQGRSITGGYVYRGRALGPDWEGRYVYGDFFFTKVFSLRPVDGAPTDVREHTEALVTSASFLSGMVSFAEGLDGELYLLSYHNGLIFRLTAESLRHFGDPTALADGWKSLPWFGSYNDRFFPFIYHADLGAFLYCDGPGARDGADSFWFHAPDRGWFWTSSSTWPLVYLWDAGEWEEIWKSSW